MFEWLTEWFQPFWNWLSESVQNVLVALDPLHTIVKAAMFFIDMLPPADPRIPYTLNNLRIGVLYAMSYVAISDYFINLGFLLLCLAVLVALEGMFLPIRIWRIVRSFIT